MPPSCFAEIIFPNICSISASANRGRVNRQHGNGAKRHERNTVYNEFELFFNGVYSQKKTHDELASAVSVQSLTLYIYNIYIYMYTLWLFNIPMENGPFIDDFPS